MQVETPCMPELKLDPENGFVVAPNNKLLTNESPLIILPQLACKVGDRHATILQQLHYLTLNLRGRVVGGKKWVRIQLREPESDEEGDDSNDLSWQGMLPYLSHSTIGKYLSELKAEGLIESKVFKGRGLHYWLNVEAVNALIDPVERIKALQKTKLNNLTIAPSRGNQSLKSRQPKPLVAAIKASSRGASKTLKTQSKTQKRIKDSAPKNGAAQGAENSLADSTQGQASEVNVDLGAVTAPPSCENLPPADKPRSAKQIDQDKWLDTIAQACGCFTPASETSDGKNSYHGKASRIGKEIKELKNLKVDLAELERMVVWFEQVNYRGQRAEKPKITDFVGELALFRAYEQSLIAVTDPAKVRAIEAIKAVCVAPVGGWEVVAERLNKAADWFIEHGYADKISGFAAYWQEIKATAAPDLDTLYRNWNKYLSSLESNHGANNNTPVYSKNSGRANRRRVEGDTPRVICTVTSDQLFA